MESRISATTKALPNPALRRKSITTKDPEELLRQAQHLYQIDVQADEHNIIPAREDIKFVIGDQWDENVRSARDGLKRPVLTMNHLPAMVAQYIGDWMHQDMSPKIAPTHGSSVAAAKARQGIIRQLMRAPEAKIAKQRALTSAYICGIGNFGLMLVDSVDDVFSRDMVLEAFEDPFQVIWDRASTEPTGKDANHAFAFHYMTREDFKERYPKAKSDAGWFTEEWDTMSLTAYGWEVDEMVRLCNFWQMRYEPVTLGLEADTNQVIDVTDMSDEERAATLAVDADGAMVIRETHQPYAEMYVMTAGEVLDGPFRFNIDRLPLFRVEGWTLYEAAVKFRWGFVRNAKDPQRLHNWWRSIMAEELRKSVAGKWLLDAATMQNGLADQFRMAHVSNDNVLFWDSQAGGARPEQIPPPPVNTAVLEQANMTMQDMQSITNMHEGQFGAGAAVSSKAITARQRVAQLGNTIYTHNCNLAESECGRVANQMIPVVMDTNRTVLVLGDDDKPVLQEINGELGDKTPDVTKGKYSLSFEVGPDYATKRQEESDMMLTLMNTMPETAKFNADIILRNMDTPGAEEMANRAAMALPPYMIDMDKLPDSLKQMAQMRLQQYQQQIQMQMQMEIKKFQEEMGKTAAETAELLARAHNHLGRADWEEGRTGSEMVKAEAAEITALTGAAKIGLDAATMFQQAAMGGQVAGAMHQGATSTMPMVEKTDQQAAAQQQAQQQPGQPGQSPSPQGAPRLPPIPVGDNPASRS